MPYGPDRLDLHLTLVNEQALPVDFFDHTSHHASDRKLKRNNQHELDNTVCNDTHAIAKLFGSLVTSFAAGQDS